MSDSVRALETRLRRRIGRRLALARWAKSLLVPTVAAIVLVHRIEWLMFAGFGVVFLEVLALMVGEAQRCPLCDASLVIRHRREEPEDFAYACPECGFLID